MAMWSLFEVRFSVDVTKKITIHVLLFVIIIFLISKIDRTCFPNIIPGTAFFNA